MRVIGLIYFLFTLLLYITYIYGAQIQKGILPSTPIPFNPLHFGEKLFQQYLVDSFVRVERDRIAWIKTHQAEIKAGDYRTVNSYLDNLAEKEGATIIKKVILPSTLPGSSRYYSEHYEDAMAIVRKCGTPDFFITMTCNSNWRDIQKAIKFEMPDGHRLNQAYNYRPDIVARVFNQKSDELIRDIDKHHIFGKVAAYVSVIEFQKRGVPHMHLLVILDKRYKIKNPERINDFICAEIPENNKRNKKLRKIVLDWMIHPPCGELNPNESCMIEKKGRSQCRYSYPKKFQEETSLIEEEMPRYRRRYQGKYDIRNKDEFSHNDAVYRKDKYRKKVTRDNRHVVPYNAYLLKRYNCHINVEYVGSIRSVKYLYKYIYKGHDLAELKIVGDDKKIIYDEPDRYVNGRYITAHEACWRHFEFNLQKRSHRVERLDLHLKGQYRNTRDKSDNFPEDLANVGQKRSTLEAYFELNKKLKEQEQKYKNQKEKIKYHTYLQIPEHYTWDGKASKWNKQQQIRRRIGRMFNAGPQQPDLYHLRLLLVNVKGATCYEDLLNVDGIQYKTFKQACVARKLTYDDKQWIASLNESKSSKMPRAMRNLFAQILIYGEPENPKQLWDKFKEDLAEDLIYAAKKSNGSKEEAIKKAYRRIAYKLETEATEGRKFKYWVGLGMDKVDYFETEEFSEIISKDDAKSKGIEMKKSLLIDQRKAVDAILESVKEGPNKSRCFFIDGPGGSGKTYVYKTLYYLMRGEGLNIKNMASTGIAATLLPEGRTAHKTFGLDVPLKSESECKIDVNSTKAKELAAVDVFFLDEAPMLPRYGIENMDTLLRKIHKKPSIPYGGTIQIFGGDFRQCLPVQPRANESELLDLSIKNSRLWGGFSEFKLEKNKRVDKNEEKFAEYLLRVGNGEEATNESGEIKIPEENISNGDLIEEVFGDCLKFKKWDDMKDRAILTPLNSQAAKFNDEVIARMDEEYTTYSSHDSVKDQTKGNDLILPDEYLNTVNVADLPPHELKLKKNAIIMLLRNLDVSEGMCNGTRLRVKNLCPNIIRAIILTGQHVGKEVHIPRITLDSSKGLGFTISRHQFPIKPAFAMTIHKSQGQTFEYVGVDLTVPVFSHGQLYVSFSRLKRQLALKVLLNKEDKGFTKNKVLKQILGNCYSKPQIVRYDDANDETNDFGNETYIADDYNFDDFYLSDEEKYEDHNYDNEKPNGKYSIYNEDIAVQYRYGRSEDVRINFRPLSFEEMNEKAKIIFQNTLTIDRPNYSENIQDISIKSPPKKYVQITGDGNCLFRCFSKAITGDERYHEIIRKEICNYMEKDEQYWTNHIGEPVRTYLDRGMRTPGTSFNHWGTDYEILAFARLLNLNVYVWNPESFCNVPVKWVPYRPDNIMQNNLYDVFIIGGNNHFNLCLSLDPKRTIEDNPIAKDYNQIEIENSSEESDYEKSNEQENETNIDNQSIECQSDSEYIDENSAYESDESNHITYKFNHHLF